MIDYIRIALTKYSFLIIWFQRDIDILERSLKYNKSAIVRT